MSFQPPGGCIFWLKLRIKLLYYYIKFFKGGVPMLKFLSKIAEKYAKATNTTCLIAGMFHQPKMPASLIKKD